MKQLRYIFSLLVLGCWIPAIAQSDIEITDSIVVDWGGGIGGGIVPNLPTDPVTSLTLSMTDIVLDGGDSFRLVAKTNITAANKAVVWSIADCNIATVSSNGVVKGIEKGVTTVTATSVSNPEISANCVVTVTSDYVNPNVIVHTDGNGVVEGGGAYAEGTEVILTAIPNDGYRFLRWSDGSTANPYNFMLYNTIELIAFFEPIEGEGMGRGRIVSINEGNYNVFYTDSKGTQWFLYAAGYNDWAVSKTPQIIKFSDGNISSEQAYASAASFMESDGYYMSNVANWDGSGPINTVDVNGGLGSQKRTWESQVFYKNDEGKHAIRLTNTKGTDWGCHYFLNIDPITLDVAAGDPSLGDVLYLWNIEKASSVTYKVYYYVGEELVHTAEVAYDEAIPKYVYEPTVEGYTFSGWIGLPETMPANDVTVTGMFSINKYLVTFRIGDEVVASDSLEYGAVIVIPEAPAKEGHTFDGWGKVDGTVPAGDVTYEGGYTVNIYNVYYYVGEELVHTAEVAYGEAIPEYVYEPTEEGYNFLGWIGDTYDTMPAHDVTYTANIDDAINNLMIDNGQLTIYDLQGRKVLNTENLKGGIYIINDKRVLIQ